MPTQVINQALIGCQGMKITYQNGTTQWNYQAGLHFEEWEKRTRTWSTQPRPYTKTLAYSDVRTTAKQYPFHLQKWQRSNSSSPWYKVYPTYSDFPGMSNDFWTLAEAHSVPDLNPVKLKVLDGVQEAKWNFPLFALEAKKTAELVFSTAKRLAKAYGQMRKGKFSKAAKELGITRDRISGPRDNWLSYRYGWMPLLGDCASAAEAAAATLVDYPAQLKVLKTSGRWGDLPNPIVLEQYYGTSSTQYAWGSGNPVRGRSVFCWQKQQTKAWLTVMCSAESVQTLNSFGLFDIASTAWEVVPFSFVADWFLGIGDYLEAQTALLGLTVVDGGTSYLSERNVYRVSYLPPNGGSNYLWTTDLSPGNTELKSRKYVRSTWDGSIAPPKLDINLNWKRLVDSAALISAVFGRK